MFGLHVQLLTGANTDMVIRHLGRLLVEQVAWFAYEVIWGPARALIHLSRGKRAADVEPRPYRLRQRKRT